VALDWYRNNTLVRTHAEQIKDLSAQYLPVTLLKNDPTLKPEIMGLVCQGLQCKKPAQTVEEMQQQLALSQTRASSD
jgi:uncharacterized protein YyaL (SSP411 family)